MARNAAPYAQREESEIEWRWVDWPAARRRAVVVGGTGIDPSETPPRRTDSDHAKCNWTWVVK